MAQSSKRVFARLALAIGLNAATGCAADLPPGSDGGEGRLPMLPVTKEPAVAGSPHMRFDMDETSIAEALVIGTLLVPVEESRALRRPDLVFACHDGHLHIFDTARHVELTKSQTRTDAGLLTKEEGIELPAKGPAVLLGCAGDVAILVQSGAAIGVDLKSCAVAWKFDFPEAGDDSKNVAEPVPRPVVPGVNGTVIINGEPFDAATGKPVPPSGGGESARQSSFSVLGRRAFKTLRIVNDKLVCVAANNLFAVNTATGKPAWADPTGNPVKIALPEGAPLVAGGTKSLIVARVDIADKSGSRFMVIDANTGKFEKDILTGEKVFWQGLWENGTLLTVSAKSVSAFDLSAKDDKPLWRRDDIQCMFAGATVLTGEGLVTVNGDRELLSLSGKTGETLWPAKGGSPVSLSSMTAREGEPVFLHSATFGEQVIYQSATGLEVFYTPKAHAEHIEWVKSDTVRGGSPPMQSFQLSDHFVVVLAVGPKTGAEHAAEMTFFDRYSGRIVQQTPLRKKAASMEGPHINAWQVVDNGIAMETGGKVYFYGAKTPDGSSPRK